ncbi:putative phospholipid-transporting ATPase 9 isoform X3 [Camellia sinensis]|uniref:putative phospholipid-transporting ATPase 9 isoform X3 n=1 Tax=Camellia sinensis TaxID=4442 RepID=UPI0010356AD6|nr:putative phospholipid-transporting ATPase 9 isoform X3 [Camellia sinensis]XP_028111916.1 putative phospholipid-transporting ATPase 9 isoform X3 [Camellia sinensis]XP_028111917.1 putative phospholipid-transporting ATPase 9 isoform X3 [Camellia sinensis]XP_028111918.1 putative phospholipid-transporting ATPase 9 isoform X3 [Camellia sinensis]XP_028111919.1 putative phospholipid-transporting ATPase 9 isoform X3 [Camellia sinensis]XP_028111920.1 putative phospholipid-transporting ATPase 9 isofor
MLHQDIEVNNRKVKVHQSDGVFEHIEWKNLRVGDIVKVEKNEFFPADLLLLSSSYEDAICYVETMNLDGETNLKLKQELKVTSFLHDDFDFRDFKALVKCEDPNANLYSFVESMEFEEQRHPLTPKQLHLRDSKLRNTDYIYGAIIFTGLDTKLDVDFVQNDVRNLRWRGPIIDTIVMNPPFRTWKKGADMDFLFATLKGLIWLAFYSLFTDQCFQTSFILYEAHIYLEENCFVLFFSWTPLPKLLPMSIHFIK